MDYTKLRNAYPDESQPSIGWLKIAHGLGFLCQLGLVIAISVALDDATDKLLAQSTVLSVLDKPRFPERIGTTSIFGEGRRLKAGKSFEALVGNLVARGANCEHTSCCRGNDYDTIEEIPEEVLISDCWIETDHRWANPYRAHVSEPGYRILWLVLMAPLISSLHHLFALYILFGK
ncbi:MAG TPA: hypothetical protein DCW74_16550, partial [Alteromonas australica]|nr:hypothetical protein [Alteromonas australica]